MMRDLEPLCGLLSESDPVASVDAISYVREVFI